jgi:hypothetical protein
MSHRASNPSLALSVACLCEHKRLVQNSCSNTVLIQLKLQQECGAISVLAHICLFGLKSVSPQLPSTVSDKASRRALEAMDTQHDSPNTVHVHVGDCVWLTALPNTHDPASRTSWNMRGITFRRHARAPRISVPLPNILRVLRSSGYYQESTSTTSLLPSTHFGSPQRSFRAQCTRMDIIRSSVALCTRYSSRCTISRRGGIRV